MRNVHSCLLMVAVLVGGCALSPQIIEVDPAINVDKAATRPVKILLEVADMRSSAVIGQRGGIYKDTSHISTADNLTANLHRNLSRALFDLGYSVARQGEPADAELIVRITGIDYSIATEKLLNKAEVKVEIQVIARKNNREFTGGFRARRTQEYVKLPSIKQNEEIVNETFAIVLKNMLQDADLRNFLGG